MRLDIPERALAVSNTLDHYAKLGLEDSVLCGGSGIYWQLAVATGTQIEALPVGLSDIDALAPYISIRALHESLETNREHIVTEWRERPKQSDNERDRATLKVEMSNSPKGIIPLQVFTGVETDRISVTHDVVSGRNEAIDVHGIACLPIARTLAWKILADRAKDREQVAKYISFIKKTRAVSYDEWEAIRAATRQAQIELRSIREAELIRWSGSG